MEESKKVHDIEVKRVMICCNGLINTRNHALFAFKNYFDNINKDPSREVLNVDLYDPQDRSTFNRKSQHERLLKLVSEYADKNYVIYLLGYSYTAGICAKMATIFPQVRKLILVSPTLYLLKTKLLVSYLKVAIKYTKLKFRNPAKNKKVMTKMHMRGIIPISYNIAMTIFQDRKYFKKVRCKVFVGKAQNDMLCIGKTLWKITNKLEQNRVTLKSYPTGGHVMIMSAEHGQACYDDILSFAFHMENPDDKKDESEEKQSTISFAQLQIEKQEKSKR